MTLLDVELEQAVYGSFPFWDRGYAILAHSPGCQPEWLTWLRTVCQHFGEPVAGIRGLPSLFTLQEKGYPRLIVGVSPPGVDDQGRPGALAFHALFLQPKDYRAAAADPFLFQPSLRTNWSDWSAEPTTLPKAHIRLNRASSSISTASPPANNNRALAIAEAIGRGKKVAIPSPEPIEALARDVVAALPLPVRTRVSLATWAFSGGNPFDLMALPRLKGVELDPSYVDPSILDRYAEGQVAFESTTAAKSRFGEYLGRAMPILGLTALLLGAALGIVLRTEPEHEQEEGKSKSFASQSAQEGRSRADRSLLASPTPTDRAEANAPEDRAQVLNALVNLAEQVGAWKEGAKPPDDPAELLIALSGRLSYRGPWLSKRELAELRSSNGPGSPLDRTRALEWHTFLARFATDRPLPAGYRDGSLRWQLETLAWSLHLDRDTTRYALLELPHVLADWLSIGGAPRRNPLSERYPTLETYHAFLEGLPRR